MSTLEEYKGHPIYDTFIQPDVNKKLFTVEEIQVKLDSNLEKGIITKELYDLAMVDLEIMKGEGSRGGKIIGHTKSGKPIYEIKNAKAEKDYSSKDHDDAAYAHLDHIKKLPEASKESRGERHNAEFDRHMDTKKYKKTHEDLDKETIDNGKDISSHDELAKHLMDNHGGKPKDDFRKTESFSHTHGRYGSHSYAHPVVDGKKDESKIVGYYDHKNEKGKVFEKPIPKDHVVKLVNDYAASLKK